MLVDARRIRRLCIRGTLPMSVMALAIAIGCGGSGDATAPGGSTPTPTLRFRVIAGGGVSDTIDARPVQALTVEIRDSTGKLAVGSTVRFEALPTDDPSRVAERSILVSPLDGTSFSNLSTDVADATGRAKTLFAFGTVAGTARIRVVVPELGSSDTVSYTVKPGLPARFVIGVRDTTVQPGGTYSLRASLTDRARNPTPTESPTYSAGAGITSVSASGQVTAGPDIARGRIVLTWQGLSDTAYVSVMVRLALVATHNTASGVRAAALVNTDGSGVSDLATSPDYSLGPHSVKAVKSVAYYQKDPEYNATLWIVEPGASARLLASPANGFASAAWPALSPDGAWVYFTGVRSNTFARSLWRIRTDGSQLDSLGVYDRTARFERVSLSPDGATVAIPGDGGVKLVNVATKTSTVLPGNCHVPRFSPDGRQFACLINEELAVMNADGTGVRVIPVREDGTTGIRFEEVAGVDWSPDGNWLIAQSYTAGLELVKVSDGSVIGLPAIRGSFIQAAFVR